MVAEAICMWVMETRSCFKDDNGIKFFSKPTLQRASCNTRPFDYAHFNQ